MAFVAFHLDKGDGVERWLSRVVVGTSLAKAEGTSVIADVFELVEAPGLNDFEDKRLFLLRAVWNIPAAIWIIGLVASVSGYWFTQNNIFFLFGAVAFGVLYLFTSGFLRFAVRLALKRARYDGSVSFYSAEGLIALAGLRTVADIRLEEEE